MFTTLSPFQVVFFIGFELMLNGLIDIEKNVNVFEVEYNMFGTGFCNKI